MNYIERLLRGVITKNIGAKSTIGNYSIDIEYKYRGAVYPIKHNGIEIAKLKRDIVDEVIIVEYTKAIRMNEVRNINKALENILNHELINYTILY